MYMLILMMMMMIIMMMIIMMMIIIMMMMKIKKAITWTIFKIGGPDLHGNRST